jgi:nucleotidyltransferase substrate binding protein (TIGR01987 family)
MNIDTTFFNRCILTLSQAHSLLLTADPKSIEYEMYRSACVKEFEIILEQAGKLLKKCLNPYFHSAKAVHKLTFKDAFRQSAQHSLITIEEVERWLVYRDNRNNTAHDYGVDFANHTLALLKQFIIDAKSLEQVIKAQPHD